MQSIEFYKDVKAVCDIAGQPALAESIINLHKACNESIDIDEISPTEEALNAAAPVTESVGSSDSAMYTIEPADDEDGPNDLYIELPASKGWTLDDAEAFAEILKDSAPNSADVFYMGSYAENGTFFQIYIDQKEVRPMTIEEWATPIKEAINEIYGDNSESGDIERSVGDSIDTAMMDHYDMMNGDIGDFESVELYKDIKAICDIAGKPALAEAVINLYKAYHPVLEAEGVAEQIFADYLEKKGITEIDAVQLERILNDMVYEKRITSSEADKIWTTVMNKAQPNMEAAEKAHKVPRDIAVAFNDYVADTLYTRPETHDQLKASEFEFNWDWLDDEAEDVIRVWNATHDPSALYRLLENADEHSACMHDGI